jgi:hypothetical protein
MLILDLAFDPKLFDKLCGEEEKAIDKKHIT